jgi:hypothetical protein
VRECIFCPAGAQNEASELAVKLTRQVGLQTARTIESAIALGLDLQKAARIGRKTSPNLPSEISRQITVGLAPQTGLEFGPKSDSRKPFGVALETTPGTVLGTVLTVVPGVST